MIPILFSENSTDFTTNGIGRLSDAISCVVDEERNGQFELQMVYPESGVHFSDIGIRRIIVAKPSALGSLQPFRIYKITKPINGKVTIYGQHISYDLSKNVCMPFSVVASSTACNTALQGLKTNAVETCPFTFWTDVDTVASYSQSAPASIRQRLGGVEGSILDQFHGEYEWDNFTVKFHEARGTEKNITLRYGKNITDLEQEENIANTVTGVVPFWINTDKSESVTLTEKVVYAPNASAYSSHLTVPLDLSGEFENKPTETQLRNKATIYVNQSGFGLPKVSIKVSFVNLADTAEYADILPLQTVSLCDTIKVQFERLGIDTTAKVVKTTYDVLNERYESIEVGSLKSTLAMTINDMNASTIGAVEVSTQRVFSDTADFVDNATAWLTSSGGYVVANRNQDGSWKELLFMDTNDVTTAHNVLRLNENGIGFSSQGVAGPYTQAWTLDGKLVVGGTNVPSITCYDSHNHVVFKADRNGAEINGDLHCESDYDEYVDIEDGEIHLTNGSHSFDVERDGSNIIIKFDNDAYIDGTGSGGERGFHLNADNVTFSVDDLHVTRHRDGNYSTGYTGTATAVYEFDDSSVGFIDLEFVNGICVGNSRD